MRYGPLLLCVISLAACGERAAPSVDHAWVRLNAVPGRPAAGYLTVHGGAREATLVAVTTPAARLAELHESMTGGMRPLANVAVPAGGEARFAPGGRHVMLIDPDPRLRPGATTTLRLRLADGHELNVPAPVVGAADPAP